VAARSKASVYGRPPAGIVGSNTTGGTDFYLSFVSVCCHVEVTSWGSSLVQRTPIDFDVSGCDRKAPIMRRPWPHWGFLWHAKENTPAKSNPRNLIEFLSEIFCYYPSDQCPALRRRLFYCNAPPPPKPIKISFSKSNSKSILFHSHAQTFWRKALPLSSGYKLNLCKHLLAKRVAHVKLNATINGRNRKRCLTQVQGWEFKIKVTPAVSSCTGI